ncbi:hypothetical protein [Bacillus sp. Cs-700]|uniref:hypothetical protein n=1 Tax=Bacillus sp. Cs-700 TaxID=2589818 RepID=UPI00140B2129|nr:hypothetical protein [Bacillus sp. Cs-700]
MTLLRKVNLLLAIIAIGMAFSHFFIFPNAISSQVFISFLFVMFLLFGTEKIREEKQNKKIANTYTVTAVILFIVLMTDLL